MSPWRTHAFASPSSAIAGVCAASDDDRPRWYFATRDGRLIGVDSDTGASFFELRLPFEFGALDRAALVASSDGRFVAVAPWPGVVGALVDVSAGRIVMTLERAAEAADVTFWALAMVHRHGRELFVFSPGGDRLVAHELPGLTLLTGPAHASAAPQYSCGALSASPGGRWVASSGWYWHPVGSVELFDVDRWLSQGSPGERHPMFRSRSWDKEVCWLSETRFACLGDGGDGSEAFGAGVSYFARDTSVVLFDVERRAVSEVLEITGPCALSSDGAWLYLLGEPTRAYYLEARTWAVPFAGSTHAWHAGARVALSCPALEGKPGLCQLVWHPSPLGPRLPESARVRALELQEHLTPNGLHVLADALEEAGVTGQALAHCRADQPHGRRCWVVEAVTAEDA